MALRNFAKNFRPQGDKTRLALVFYRGHWCPPCRGYLGWFDKHYASITQQGFSLYGVCSEPEPKTKALKERLGLKYDLISDQRNELVQAVRDDYSLPLHITQATDVEAYCDFLRDTETYPVGNVQPGLLFLDLKADGNHEVIYKWAQKPSLDNHHGALFRPDVDGVWDLVQARIAGKAAGDDVPLASMKYTLEN